MCCGVFTRKILTPSLNINTGRILDEVISLRNALFFLATMTLVFFSAFGIAFATPADHDCNDFSSQEEAQKYWDEKGYSADHDPERLDADGDGIPCEQGESNSGSSDNGSNNSGNNGSSDNGTEPQQGSGSSESGGKLPKTATSYPVNALAGLGMLVVGAIFFVLHRRLT